MPVPSAPYFRIPGLSSSDSCLANADDRIYGPKRMDMTGSGTKVLGISFVKKEKPSGNRTVLYGVNVCAWEGCEYGAKAGGR
jgi:hypothetical protein